MSAFGAIVEGPFVDVESDEAVGEVGVEAPAKLQGVADGFGAVFETKEDGSSEDFGDLGACFWSEVSADEVAAQGEGELGAFEPPFSQIEGAVKALLGIGEL